jgi:hypothetical protein
VFKALKIFRGFFLFVLILFDSIVKELTIGNMKCGKLKQNHMSEPKSIEEVPNWVIVNALRCPIDAQISIVAKILQHLDHDQRAKALSMYGVMESDCDHDWLNHSFDHFGFLQEQICDKCGAKQSVP